MSRKDKYIELALKYFGTAENVPVFSTAIQDDKFREVWERNKTSGYYPDANTPNGKYSHAQLSKDTEQRPGFELAKRLATEESRKYALAWKFWNKLSSGDD